MLFCLNQQWLIKGNKWYTRNTSVWVTYESRTYIKDTFYKVWRRNVCWIFVTLYDHRYYCTMNRALFTLIFIGFFLCRVTSYICYVEENQLAICKTHGPVKSGEFVYSLANQSDIGNVCCLALGRKNSGSSGTYTPIGTCLDHGVKNKLEVLVNWNTTENYNNYEYPEIRCRSSATKVTIMWDLIPFSDWIWTIVKKNHWDSNDFNRCPSITLFICNWGLKFAFLFLQL